MADFYLTTDGYVCVDNLKTKLSNNICVVEEMYKCLSRLNIYRSLLDLQCNTCKDVNNISITVLDNNICNISSNLNYLIKNNYLDRSGSKLVIPTYILYDKDYYNKISKFLCWFKMKYCKSDLVNNKEDVIKNLSLLKFSNNEYVDFISKISPKSKFNDFVEFPYTIDSINLDNYKVYLIKALDLIFEFKALLLQSINSNYSYNLLFIRDDKNIYTYYYDYYNVCDLISSIKFIIDLTKLSVIKNYNFLIKVENLLSSVMDIYNGNPRINELLVYKTYNLINSVIIELCSNFGKLNTRGVVYE